jgi:hypothetical protein
MTKHDKATEAARDAYHENAADHGHGAALQRAIAAYLAAMREPGQGEVRIRVCAAVNRWANGQPGYNAVGWSGTNDKALREVAGATRCGEHDPQFRWVEATVQGWREDDEPVVEGEVAS